MPATTISGGNMKEFLSSEFGQIFIQMIGFGAMAMNVLSFQARRRTNILLMQFTGALLWMTQFLLLGGLTGALMNVFAMIRNLTYSVSHKHKWLSSRPVLFVFLAVCVGFGIYSYSLEGWRSLFPSVAMIIATVAFSLKKEYPIRILSLFIGPLWLVYDVISFSIAGTLSEILSIASIVIALIKFDKDNLPRKNKSTAEDI